MALRRNHNPDETYASVGGVYEGQATDIRLGEARYSAEIALGAENELAVVGIDTTKSPAELRIYYDKGDAQITGVSGRDRFYGLVMTCQHRFDNTPIPPGVLNKELEFQDDWVTPIKRRTGRAAWEIDPDGGWVVNMMSPAKLLPRNISDPYFANNALCWNTGQVDTFSVDAPNGFFADDIPGKPASADRRTPLCASLIAPLQLDVDVPFSHLIGGSTAPGYRLFPDEFIELGDAEDPPIDVNGDIRAQILERFHKLEADLISRQYLGNSWIFTFDDPEEFNLVVHVDGSSGKLTYLDINELDHLRFQNTSDIFEAFVTWKDENELSGGNYPERQGPYTRSYRNDDNRKLQTMLSNLTEETTREISTHYKIYCVGSGASVSQSRPDERVYTCIGGVQFTVKRAFDPEYTVFGPIEIVGSENDYFRSVSNEDVLQYNRELHLIYLKDMGATPTRYGAHMPELTKYLDELRAHRDGKKSESFNEAQWFTSQTGSE